MRDTAALLGNLFALRIQECAHRIIGIAEMQFALAAQAQDFLAQSQRVLCTVPRPGSVEGAKLGASRKIGMHDPQVLRIDEYPQRLADQIRGLLQQPAGVTHAVQVDEGASAILQTARHRTYPRGLQRTKLPPKRLGQNAYAVAVKPDGAGEKLQR